MIHDFLPQGEKDSSIIISINYTQRHNLLRFATNVVMRRRGIKRNFI